MFKSKRRSKNSGPGFFRRMIRSIFSIVVLSALILGITIFMRELSGVDVDKIAYLAGLAGLDQQKAGEVAGEFAKRVSNTDVGLDTSISQDVSNQNETVGGSDIISSSNTRVAENSTAIVKVAVFADSHSDLNNLQKAIDLAKDNNVDAVFHLGDHTNLGVLSSLEDSKKIMDASELNYYAVPGDRDLYDSVGSDNFTATYGTNFHSITINGYKFVALDNSANYTTIPSNVLVRFQQELQDADFVLLSQPLYHPSTKVMGVTDGEEVPEVREQALEILGYIRDSNVKAIIAAEQHISSETTDSVDLQLKHIVVGAITETINDRPQRILQTPRFSILNITEEGDYYIKQIVL